MWLPEREMSDFEHLFDSLFLSDPSMAIKIARTNQSALNATSKDLHHNKQKHVIHENSNGDSNGIDEMERWFRKEIIGEMKTKLKPSPPAAAHKRIEKKEEGKNKKNGTTNKRKDTNSNNNSRGGGGGLLFVPKVYAPECTPIFMRIAAAVMQEIAEQSMTRHIENHHSDNGNNLRFTTTIKEFE